MQRIEKYAVIALVLLLVTILAVSLWSQKKGKSPFSFFKRGSSTEVAQAPTGNEPAVENNFTTTDTGATPGTGLAPMQQDPQGVAGTNLGNSQVGAGGAQRVGDPTMPADWRPGQPWVNRGRVGAVHQGEAGQTVPGAQQQFGMQQPSTNDAGQTGFVNLQPQTPRVNAPKSAVESPADRRTLAAGPTYVVQSGDTLGEIAARQLGSAAKWTEIAKLNDNLDPKKLRKGMKLVMPAGAKVAAAPKTANAPAVAPGGEYVVRKGDTLSEIANKVLGKTSRWTEIAALNPSIDANRLIVGTHLRLPKGVAAGGVAVGSSTVAKVERKNRVR
ncbi:MAG: LysM peptidoglycan-binding domain-containing protein [Planctomycetes bacterium]|nr:LysM peptidoglycan-binding domain-containing protein [Planctomycetota bacterium]